MINMPPIPPEAQAKLEAMLATGEFQLPPPIFLDMEGEILAIDLDIPSLIARFPVKPRYQNPMGYMQGGMITAAIDNTVGPLSVMVADPNVTKSMEVRFRRPVLPTLDFITVEATVESSSKREIIFATSVKDDNGKELASARSIHVIVRVLPDMSSPA